MKRSVLITIVASLSGIIAVNQSRIESTDAQEPAFQAASMLAGYQPPAVRELPSLDPAALEVVTEGNASEGSTSQAASESVAVVNETEPAADSSVQGMPAPAPDESSGDRLIHVASAEVMQDPEGSLRTLSTDEPLSAQPVDEEPTSAEPMVTGPISELDLHLGDLSARLAAEAAEAEKALLLRDLEDRLKK